MRLLTKIIDRQDVTNFFGEVRAAGVDLGNMHTLLRFDIARADR